MDDRASVLVKHSPCSGLEEGGLSLVQTGVVQLGEGKVGDV